MKTEENANEVPNCFCLIKFNESILGNYHPQPKHVGGFRIGNTVGYSQINLLTKPIWFHRKMMKLCLGWEWVNNEQTNINKQ